MGSELTEPHVVLSRGAAGGEEHFTPSVAVEASGAWTVWQGYRAGSERILARFCPATSLALSGGWVPRRGDRFAGHVAGGSVAGEAAIRPHDAPRDDQPGALEEVAAGGQHATPFVGVVDGRPVAVWLRGRGEGDGFQVVSAVRGGGGWEHQPPVSDSGQNVAGLFSLDAAAIRDRMWAAWCAAEGPGTYSIWAACLAHGAWPEPVRVTPAAGHCHRPQVAPAPDGCWIAWDAYDGGTFAVWAAFVSGSGEVGPAERVSPPPDPDREPEGLITPRAWQFVPSICVDAGGAPWVAWLCAQDVMNEEGVVDQWPVARVARRTMAGWEIIRDRDGSSALARMAWGLLSYQGHGVWGYLGRRRRPLVVADPEGGAWLLWERKAEHDGRTLVAQGVLCGRRLTSPPATPPRLHSMERGSGGEVGSGVDSAVMVGPTLVVATGPRYYVPGGIQVADGRRVLWVAVRAHPDLSCTDVGLAAYPLESATAFEPREDWRGWRALVVGEPRAEPRPAVQHGGRKLQLYWADLHVHTWLSADAEGHVDETIAYARDKAHLDCMAISDNDQSHLSLTASDWETYRHYVRHFHRDGRFVLLPAYEWTYRPRAQGTPNHRTVLGVAERLPVLRHQDVDPAADRMAALAQFAREHDLLLHVHHERWELTEPPSETNWEICSGWGSHFADPERRQKYLDALAAGRRLGFTGNSDGHRRNPGLGGALTGIWAESPTRAGIMEALRARRCFATDGSRIAVRFWAGEAFMGEETAISGTPHIRWEVAVPRLPATVTLVRDGATVTSWRVERAVEASEFVDAGCPPGAHYYYLAVEQAGQWREWPSNVAIAWGPHAWSSPIWVERR